MRILIVLLFIAMIAFASRPATKEGPCPDKDVVFFIPSPIGPMPVGIEKDFFNKDREGKDWMDLEIYNELMGEEEPSEEDNKTQPI